MPVKLRSRIFLTLRGAALLSAAALICFKLRLNSGAASLVLLVTLVFHSLDAAFPEAAVLATLAVGIVDFFFIEPLFTFTVSDPADVIALLCFLLTLLIVTRVQAQMRAQRRNAESLYEVSQSLIALPAQATLGKEFLERVCAASGCTTVSLYDASLARLNSAGQPDADLEIETQRSYKSGASRPFVAVSGRVTVCLTARGEAIGAIGFAGLSSQAIALPLAALTATGLDRAAAFEQARTEALNAEAEQLRSAILDALAHEFKVPLATVMTAAGGLMVTGGLTLKQAELAGLIESESERLSAMSTRLLRLARLDRDQVSPQSEIADLTELAQTVARRHRFIWPDRHIIAKSASPVEVLVDPELIRLVLTQLLDNACRYARLGSDIDIETSWAGESAFVTVKNAGPAIPAHEHDSIFNRFFRGEQARQSASGSGLGLYVARKIAIAHTGALELVETSDDCVIFRLTLPRHAE